MNGIQVTWFEFQLICLCGVTRQAWLRLRRYIRRILLMDGAHMNVSSSNATLYQHCHCYRSHPLTHTHTCVDMVQVLEILFRQRERGERESTLTTPPKFVHIIKIFGKSALSVVRYCLNNSMNSGVDVISIECWFFHLATLYERIGWRWNDA